VADALDVNIAASGGGIAAGVVHGSVASAEDSGHRSLLLHALRPRAKTTDWSNVMRLGSSAILPTF
jgi:hypothetical protein